MPTIAVDPTIGAGVTVPNIFTGSAFEFARRRGIVSMGVTAAAVGIVASFTCGADMIAEDFGVPVLDRYPVIPDEMYFSDVVEAGDRLKVSVRNPTGAGIIVRSILQLQDA